MIESLFEVNDFLSLMGELFALEAELFALKQNQSTQLTHYLLGALRLGWIRLWEAGELHEVSYADSQIKRKDI